jgi:cyclopropane fatty-acyl-phospholipid synthase-like methyltransferase
MSMRAIELAKTKATERGVEARFVVADALRLVDLGEQFDTVLDCGLFHVLDDGERKRYVASLAEVVPPGGRYHMLCRGMGNRIHRVRRHRPHLGPRRSPGLAGSGHPQVEG